MTEDEPDARGDQLELIHQEVEAALGSYTQRYQAMQSRAGLLVAGASIASTLATSGAVDWAVTVAVIFGFIAAALGVAALFPMKSTSLDASVVRASIYGVSKGQGLLWLIDHKISLLQANEGRITTQAVLVSAGFAAFAGSVFFTMIATLVALDG